MEKALEYSSPPHPNPLPNGEGAGQRPLRILHLTLGADAGGLSHYIIELGSAMHALGHQIFVAGDTGAWQWAFDRSPLKYIQIPLKGGVFSFLRSVRTMRSFLAANEIDVLHTHYRRATLLARRIQREMRPAILYTLHLSHLSLKFPRNLFSDFGDITHVASEDARDWLIEDAHLRANQIRFIPHGVDTQRFSITTPEQRLDARRRLHLNPDDIVALFVGRLDYPKNEEWLLDLAAQSRLTIPKLKVLLVGEGPHEAMLNERIARENLTERVRLTGHQDTLPFYRAADAVLLPSIREGFSFVCAEAMATGIPALRTQTSGTRELIVENFTGRSVPIDHDAFVETSIEFLRDESSLKKMGAAASEHVRKNFSFPQQISRTLDLYRSMTRMDRPPV